MNRISEKRKATILITVKKKQEKINAENKIKARIFLISMENN